MNYKGFYLVRKWPYHVLNYLNNINMLEFREALFSKGRLGGILQIDVVTILRTLIYWKTGSKLIEDLLKVKC